MLGGTPDRGGNMEAEASGSAPTDEPRRVQLEVQMVQLRNENLQLQEKLKKRGKEPDRGRQPRPGPSRNYFSVPRPPGYSRPPPDGPLGNWNMTDPPAMAGVKPLLMKPPRPFAGKHDDIKQFLGDCTTYFEIFWQYYQNVPSLMVLFLEPWL